MAWSQYDLTDTQKADAAFTQSLRNADLADDLKLRLAAAVRQWIYVNDVQLEDPMWGGFARRSQECLQTVIIGKLNDCCDDIAGDYLGGDQ